MGTESKATAESGNVSLEGGMASPCLFWCSPLPRCPSIPLLVIATMRPCSSSMFEGSLRGDYSKCSARPCSVFR